MPGGEMHPIYLDHNATTPLHSEAFEAMKPYLTNLYGNASSLHWAGKEAKQALEKARDQVAALIGSHPREIVFHSGATESINMILKGLFTRKKNPKKHIIISAVDHHATHEVAETLHTQGVSVSVVGVDGQGRINPDDVTKEIREDTGLVSVLWVNNEVGNVYPVKEIIQRAHTKNVPVHIDAAQALGKISVDMQEITADFLSMSAHKVYGPKGVGASFIRQGQKLRRLVDGGEQERNLRGGTENIAGIVGFGMAAEIAQMRLVDDMAHAKRLIKRLQDGLLKKFPDLIIHGDSQSRVSNTLNVHIPASESEALLIALDLEGIAVSAGSACASGAIEPSHVLLAMGCSPRVAKSSLRFSVGRGNSVSDIDYVLERLPRLVQQLKAA
jgi:cysteine desulfurase